MTNALGGAVIQLSLRGDTLVNWLAFNPILNDRELVIETDTRRFKIGDGATTYSNLPYAGSNSEYDPISSVTDANIELTAGDFFSKTITAPTTFTVSNAAPVGFVTKFTLQLVNGGSHLVTWFNNTRWPNGVKPTLTSVGVDLLEFVSIDGGQSWDGKVFSLNSRV
jgi:hypothetical protein